MKLTLKNFRCHKDNCYDFGDTGIVLLSGNSGVGKTSILMAINFVLFGKGTKLTTFGTTSCSVEMETQNHVIKRSKRPNRLVLRVKDENIEYEDDSAQSIILNIYGEAFDVTSYVSQNNIQNFIMLSPLEKLAFLEKFAFNNTDIGKIKGRCNATIKKRNEELISVTSQLEMATTHLESLSLPEKVKFPFKVSKNNYDKAIQKEKNRLDNTKIKIKKSQEKLLSLQKSLNDENIIKVKRENIQEKIDFYQKKVLELSESLSSIEYIGDEELDTLKKRLKKFLKQKEHHLAQEKYNTDLENFTNMKKKEERGRKQELEKIGTPWNAQNKEEAESDLEGQKDILLDIEKIETLHKKAQIYKTSFDITSETDKVKKINDELETLQEKMTKLSLLEDVYICPSCNVNLRIEDDELVILDDGISDNINAEDTKEDYGEKIVKKKRILEKTSNKIQEEKNKQNRYDEIQKEILTIQESYDSSLPEKDEVISNIEYLEKYIKENIEKETRLKYLNQKKLSSTLISLEEKLKQDFKKLQDHKDHKDHKDHVEDSDNLDEEEIRETINTQSNFKNKIQEYSKQLEEDENSLDIYKKELEDINSVECIGIENMEEKINAVQDDIKILEEKIKIYSENLEKVDLYSKYKEEKGRYMEWKKKIGLLTVDEKLCRNRYSAITLLKDKILEAESIAVLNIINSINSHSQEYLDIFFPTDPIVVRLLPFKTSKKSGPNGKNKPQINIEIDYKGNQCDTSSLSGGELSRVVLAYTLALAEIFNSPMILLDECTASLDQELTAVVMEGIKTNFADKLVISICHQVVSGNFDRTILL